MRDWGVEDVFWNYLTSSFQFATFISFSFNLFPCLVGFDHSSIDACEMHAFSCMVHNKLSTYFVFKLVSDGLWTEVMMLSCAGRRELKQGCQIHCRKLRLWRVECVVAFELVILEVETFQDLVTFDLEDLNLS
jgi:hypothetical protein